MLFTLQPSLTWLCYDMRILVRGISLSMPSSDSSCRKAIESWSNLLLRSTFATDSLRSQGTHRQT